MLGRAAIIRSKCTSTTVVVLSLIALCFSVGEGLRLTPFPISHNVETNQEAASTLIPRSQVAIYTYGPLDVPTQPQKRSKRFAIDWSGVVAQYTYEPLTRRDLLRKDHSPTFNSTLLVATVRGRAPPFTS